MLISTILLTAALGLLLVYLIHRLVKWNEFRKQINLLPGPRGLPFFGNVIDFIGSQEKIFKHLRQLGEEYGQEGIVRIWLGHMAQIGLGHPSDVENLISSTKHNSKSDLYDLLHIWLGTGLLTSDGSKWQSRRKILTPSFHFNILQEFFPVFTEQTDILVDELMKVNGQVIDVVQPITQFTLHSILETAMGTTMASGKDQEEYKSAVYKMGEFIVYRITRPWFFFDPIFAFTKSFWEQKSLAKYLHNFSYGVIADKRKQLSKFALSNNNMTVQPSSYSTRKKLAMLDMLISANLQGAPIDDVGIREEVDTFMFEGHDTTSMSICFTLMLIANHKDIQEKIYEEIYSVFGDSDRKITSADIQELNYLERCIKESLRLYPSVPMISRILSEDFITQGGYKIPAKTSVNVFIYDMHRREELFENPEVFDPDRFLPENTQKRHPFIYIPFSAGPRNCIGQKFALMEIKTVITGILRNFILEPVDTPETVVLITDLVLRPKNGIKMKFIKRNNLNVSS
ncbi:cytochrome P450 4C1 [Aethina tumida]|uniref:cytochrome P450 4C1 n=1 Tax=Aethina tumida TaxID=116153 RepID=UPI00096AF9A1|nr:cytochrome P450 4C1 [Aethina tumida]